MQHYVATTIVDTILCLDGTQIIGAYLAQELNQAGFVSINAHQTIYVVTPEYDATSQLIFRDNLQPMIRDKHVLILTASVTTGISVRKAMECVQYYGGTVAGACGIFSACPEVDGMKIQSIFGRRTFLAMPRTQSTIAPFANRRPSWKPWSTATAIPSCNSRKTG